MKRLLYPAMLLSILSAGCDSRKTSTSTSREDTVGTNTSINDRNTGMTNTEAPATVAQPVTDAGVTSFVKKALSGGMMEVELGTLAGSNAQSQRVKDFGAMMVADHSQSGNELKSMASANSIEVPSAMMPEHQQHIAMLNNKKGSAFDKAYMDMMVKDHKNDISEFTSASNKLAVDAYKTFAGKTVPVLQKHLDSAQAIYKSLK